MLVRMYECELHFHKVRPESGAGMPGQLFLILDIVHGEAEGQAGDGGSDA